MKKQPIPNSSSRKYKFCNCCGFGKNHKLLTVQRGKYKSFQTILGRIYWNFTEVLYKFDLSQLKPNLISSRNNFICKLPIKFSNNLRLWKNLKIGRKHTLDLTISSRNKNLTIMVKNQAKADVKLLRYCQILLNILF